jgi:cbb3-type cytochrome c oxidase subunit III
MSGRSLAASVVLLALAFGACKGGEKAQQQQAAPEAPAAAPAAAAPAGEAPAGATQAMVDEGSTLFHGAGLCATCHGVDAKGVPGLGANLTDTVWLHSDGSYPAIVKQIMEGVPANVSTSGSAMPAKGGSSLTDDQVKAVAAYVWSLSHPKPA